MELTPEALVRWKGAPRLIPSRYPVAGLLDRVGSPPISRRCSSSKAGRTIGLAESSDSCTRFRARSGSRAGRELREVGAFETRVQMRVYLADFSARFMDVRQLRRSHSADGSLYDLDSYAASQKFAQRVLDSGGNGIVYRSVRNPAGECLACFRPALVRNVRAGGHYEFRWSGRPEPSVRKL
jgi:hypothetical protein